MKIEVKLNNQSKGVYAVKDIRKGEIIFKIQPKQFISKPTRYSVQVGLFKHIEAIPDSSEQAIDSFFWRYMNHCCDANCLFNPSDLSFRAKRKIAAGEHLTFNYLTNEYEMAEPFSCECGADNCFKKIAGFKQLTDKQKEQLLPQTAEHVRLMHMREEVLG